MNHHPTISSLWHFIEKLLVLELLNEIWLGNAIFFNFDENMPSISGFICAKTMTYIAKMHGDKPVQNLIY